METLQETTQIGYEGWTDEDLLGEYRMTGNRELFETLVRRYEKELYRFLYTRTGSSDVAEDVFQATFLLVYQKSEQFDTSRRFRPWLYRIASNQAIDTQRWNRRRTTVSLDNGWESPDEDRFSPMAILESDEPDPEASAINAEEAAALHNAIRRLIPEHQEVIELIYFRDLGYQETADLLGIPMKTVASRLAAAKKRLVFLFPTAANRG